MVVGSWVQLAQDPCTSLPAGLRAWAVQEPEAQGACEPRPEHLSGLCPAQWAAQALVQEPGWQHKCFLVPWIPAWTLPVCKSLGVHALTTTSEDLMPAWPYEKEQEGCGEVSGFPGGQGCGEKPGMGVAVFE